jgi:radical SAM superfamily enzyme YgiQ (UPF0313 family)
LLENKKEQLMNITLITPRMRLRPFDSEYKRVLSPPLSLLTLAALTPRKHQVTIQDENVAPLPTDERPDLVGITVNVDTSSRAYALARNFRARGVPVILGGIHPSANPEEALQHADAVCIGEAEGQWERVLEDLRKGRLQKRYFNTGPVDLSDAPGPRWELLEPSRYVCTNVIAATRGCPHRCEFCYNSCAYTHGCHRTPSVEKALSEIARLGTKHVLFIDDNLIGNIPWAKSLVEALTPLHLKWHAAVSANIVEHPNLLDDMKKAGCKSLFIGFESINPESIRSVHKNQNKTDRYTRLIEALHTRGILVNASLVFGFDHDGPQIFDETLAWLVKNRIASMTSHILTPYPGTVLFDRLKAAGRITDFDWRHYNTAKVVFEPKQMSPTALLEGYHQMYREFYSLPSIIKRLPRDQANWMPYMLFNLAYRKFGNVTSRLARAGMMNSVGALARRLSYGIG